MKTFAEAALGMGCSGMHGHRAWRDWGSRGEPQCSLDGCLLPYPAFLGFGFASVNMLGLFHRRFLWGSGIWMILPHQETFSGVVYRAWPTVALDPHGSNSSRRGAPATESKPRMGPVGRAAAMGADVLLSGRRRLHLDAPGCSAKQHRSTPSRSSSRRRQQPSCQKPSSC